MVGGGVGREAQNGGNICVDLAGSREGNGNHSSTLA